MADDLQSMLVYMHVFTVTSVAAVFLRMRTVHARIARANLTKRRHTWNVPRIEDVQRIGNKVFVISRSPRDTESTWLRASGRRAKSVACSSCTVDEGSPTLGGTSGVQRSFTTSRIVSSWTDHVLVKKKPGWFTTCTCLILICER